MSYNDKMRITVDCTRVASEQLKPLLEQLQIMGNIGASRKIEIQDWNRKEEWGRKDFYFDGDGASEIDNIEIETVKEK